MITVEEQMAELHAKVKRLEQTQVKIGSGTLSAANTSTQTGSVTLPDGTVVANVGVIGNYIPEAGQQVHFLTNGTQPIIYPPTAPIVSAPPAQVSGVTATPGIGSLVVRWAAIIEADVKWNRGYYQVQTDTVNTFNSGNLKSVDAAGTSATVADLVSATLYYIRVRGVDYVGQAGAWSTTITATPNQVAGTDLNMAIGGANVILNSSFENSVAFGANWTMDGTHVTWAAETTDVKFGTKAAKATVTNNTFGGNADHYGKVQQDYQFVNYEGPWTMSAWVKAPAGRGIGLSAWREYDVAGVRKYPWDAGYPGDATASPTLNVLATGAWQRLVMPIPADTSTSAIIGFHVRAGVGATTGWVNGDVLRLDGIQLEMGDTVTAYSPPPDEIMPLTITAAELATDSVIAAKIATDAVTGPKIATDAVTAGKIQAGSVTAVKIAAGAVTTEKLTVGSLGDSVLLNNSFEEVTEADATKPSMWNYNNTYGTTNNTKAFVDFTNQLTGTKCLKIQPGSGQASAMESMWFACAPGEVWYLSCWVKAVGTNAGTSPGLYIGINGLGNSPNDSLWLPNPGLWGNMVAPTSWTKYETQLTVPAASNQLQVVLLNYSTNTGVGLLFDQVELRKVTVSAVIADGAILTNKIAALQVTAGKIATGTITATQIAANTITSNEILANTIQASDIAANTITAGEIAANAVDTSELNANAVTAAKIQAINIEAGKYVRSTTYVAGSSGWSINADGSAEFGNVIVRGEVSGTYIYGSTFTGVLAGNVVPNPGAESNTTGWAASNNTLTRTTTAGQFRSGVGAFKLQSSASGDMYIETPTGTSGFPIKPGVQYSCQAFFKSAAVARNCKVEIRMFNSSGTFTTAWSAQYSNGINAWRGLQVSIGGGVPAGSVYASVRLTILATSAANEIHYIDDVAFQATSTMYSDMVTGPQGAPRLQIYSDIIPQIIFDSGIDGEATGQVYRNVGLVSSNIDRTAMYMYSGYTPGGSAGDAAYIQVESKGQVSGFTPSARIVAKRFYVQAESVDWCALAHSSSNSVFGVSQSTNSGGSVEPSTTCRINNFIKRTSESYLEVECWINSLYGSTGFGTVGKIYIFDGITTYEMGRTFCSTNAGIVNSIYGKRHILGGAAAGTYSFFFGWGGTNGEWINTDGNSNYGISVKEIAAP